MITRITLLNILYYQSSSLDSDQNVQQDLPSKICVNTFTMQ